VTSDSKEAQAKDKEDINCLFHIRFQNALFIVSSLFGVIEQVTKIKNFKRVNLLVNIRALKIIPPEIN